MSRCLIMVLPWQSQRLKLEDYPIGLGASLAEVRQTVLEAKEHEDDPGCWITWEEIDEEFRNRYPGWK